MRGRVFYIQASNPALALPSSLQDLETDSISHAIAQCFPKDAEVALFVWKRTYIPLCYKYELSWMIEDILSCLEAIRRTPVGTSNVSWSPDTFQSEWSLSWNRPLDELKITATWENGKGCLLELAGDNEPIFMSLKQFEMEWKKLLENILSALVNLGFRAEGIEDMRRLEASIDSIDGYGLLYK